MTIAALSSMNTNPMQQAAFDKNKKAVHEAAVKFEAMYMTEMLGHMFAGLKSDGPFDGGHGEQIFRSLMTEQYGKIVAESGQTGISASLEKEMLKMQEAQQNPHGTV
jgi:peptidoglycan hydrolase FlgJ